MPVSLFVLFKADLAWVQCLFACALQEQDWVGTLLLLTYHLKRCASCD